MIVESAGVAAIGSLLVLTVRYLRHHPRGFRRCFPGFVPALATHRGFGKHAAIPENTLLAFRSSDKLGFRAHELDARRTRDRRIMLLHGPRLEEATNGRGRMESAHSLDVMQLDAAHYLQKEHPRVRHSTQKVPTLSEVLAAIHPQALINVEIKRDRWDFSYGLEEETLRTVLASPARDRVFLSGFHFLTHWRLRKLRCPLPVGLLVEPGILTHAKNFVYRFLLLPDNIHLHQSTESAAYIRRLRRRGYGLAFWTVNDADQARRLFAYEADIVITDKMDFIKLFPAPAHRRGSVQRKRSRRKAALR